MSLDGFIAGPNGEYDWITMDPTIDFTVLFGEFDTLLMGRKTFQALRAQGPGDPSSGMKVIVCSKTLQPSDFPDVDIISVQIEETVRALKRSPGKDIWLFGGGVLFRTLLDAQLVDTIEVAIMPVLLGTGIPLSPVGQRSPALHLETSRVLPSGIVMLTYAIKGRAH